jgi:hypothetical protein
MTIWGADPAMRVRHEPLSVALLGPTVKRQAQIILTAIVLKNLTVGTDYGNAQALFHVFPINNLVSLVRDENHIFQVP